MEEVVSRPVLSTRLLVQPSVKLPLGGRGRNSFSRAWQGRSRRGACGSRSANHRQGSQPIPHLKTAPARHPLLNLPFAFRDLQSAICNLDPSPALHPSSFLAGSRTRQSQAMTPLCPVPLCLCVSFMPSFLRCRPFDIGPPFAHVQMFQWRLPIRPTCSLKTPSRK
jgi:hypothetical protein